MGDMFNFEAVRQVLLDAFSQLGDNVAALFPSLVATIALLLVGWAVSRVGEAVTRRALQRVGLDQAAERIGLADALARSGVSSPLSRLIGRLLFWIVMMTFVVSAAEALGLDAATTTINRLIAFLPRVIVGGLILFVGLLLGRLVRSVVTSAALAAQIVQGERLGALVGSLVVLLVTVLALEQLGIETTIVVTLVTVLVGTGTLALGAAFAMGARPVIGHILAGHFLRQSLTNGTALEVDGRKGTVETVSSVETLVRDEERLWSIPNGRLLEEVMLR